MARHRLTALHLLIALMLLLGALPVTGGAAFAQDADPTVEPTVEATAPPAETPEPTPTETRPPAETPAAVETPESVATSTASAVVTATAVGGAKTPRARTATPEATETATTEPPATKAATKTATAAIPAPDEPKLAVTTPAVTISKTSGPVGTSVIVNATGFPAGATLALRWDGVQITSVRSSGKGAASFTLRVPAAYSGAHKIGVSTAGKTRTKTFTVTPRMTISPLSGKPGTTVNVTLTGFAASERVTVRWAGKTNIATGTTDRTGGWRGSFKVPSGAAAGGTAVRAYGTSGATASRTFTVLAIATPTPTKTATATATPTATPTKTPTATPIVDPGRLEVDVVDEGGDPLVGGCFRVFKNVNGARGVFLAAGCDADDGADGTTSFPELPAGAVIVAQSAAAEGYLPAVDAQATVVKGATRTVEVENRVNRGITVVKTDEGGAPLTGSCFALFTDIGGGKLGVQVRNVCDSTDGADGIVAYGEVDPGAYVLVESVVPRGYARAEKRRLTVVAGKGQVIAVPNQPGGSVVVTLVNEAGDPVVNACFDVYVDLGGGAIGNFIDRGCNDAGSVYTVSGLPVGNYYLVESKTPVGYKTADNIKFTIVAKKDTALRVVNLPTTKAVIRKQNQGGQPLTGSCFQVYKNSGGARGTVVGVETCDNDDGNEDGYVGIAVSPGSYLLAETKAPRKYLIGSDVPFRIQAGRDTELDVPNQLGGTLRITNYDTEYDWLAAGGCFTVWGAGAKGPHTTQLGSACDNGDGKKDGITIIDGLPTGSWTLEQSKTPWGYFDAADVPVDAVAAELIDVDFFNEPWPLVIVHKVDENGDPLTGACFEGYADLGGGQRGPKWLMPDGKVCVDEFGDAYFLVTPGNHILVEVRSPLGYLPLQDTRLTTVRGQVTELTVQNFQVGLITVTKTDLEGKPLTGACFEAYKDVNGRRGALTASACDKETGDGSYNPSLDAITILNGLPPGDYWLVEKTPPKGFFPAEDILVTVDAADNPVTVEDEPWPMLTITKVDDAGDMVKGACFQLFTISGDKRGTSVGGQACGTLNNIVKIGAPPGTYWLAETKTPTGFVTAPDVKVTFVRGQDMARTIVNKPAGFLEVTNLKEDDKPLAGSCWELYVDVGGQKGEKVAKECNSTLSKTPGITVLDAAPGNYWLVQQTVPDGYKGAADVKVTLIARESTKITIKNQPYPRLVINSTNAGNEPLIGACFDIYLDEGTKLGQKVATKLCDKDDGANDGATTKRLPPGRYAAIEVTAPAGFARSPQFKFTIETGKDLVLTLQHQIAGVIQVTTTDRAATVLKGACYELWTKTTTGNKGVLVTKACDKNSEEAGSLLDGMTRLFALPPGVYILAESFPPTGYLRAADREVTVVGGQTLELTIINDKT